MLAHAGKTTRAIEVAAMAENHNLGNPFIREKAEQLLGELEGYIPLEIFLAAQERGKSLDVEVTAQELLKELQTESISAKAT